MNRTVSAALAAAALTACGSKDGATAPWLTMPSRSSHQNFFPISSGAHASATCTDCHGGATSAMSSFKQFDCLGCHTNDAATDVFPNTTTDLLHAPVTAGYSYTSAACLGCHADGSVSMPNHDPIFPIAAGSKHSGIVCSACHTVAGDRQIVNLACASCHAQTTLGIPATPAGHVKVVLTAGKTWAAATSADCLMCHADGQVTAVATHGQGVAATPFRISANTAHAGSACLQCHVADGVSAPTMRTDKTWAIDFSAHTCISCHDQATTTTNHASVSGFSYGTASCLNCHPDGAGGEPPTHPALFPIGSDPGSQHPGFACSSCHTTPGTVGNPAATIAGLDCVTCHASTTTIKTTAAGHTAVGLTGGKTWATVTSADCLTCHADSQVSTVASHAPKAAFRIPHDRAGSQCLTCHTAPRADKPFGQDFTGYTCLACHRDHGRGTSCFPCHTSGSGD